MVGEFLFGGRLPVSPCPDPRSHWLCRPKEECSDKLLSEGEKKADRHEREFDRDALLRMSKLDQTRECVMGWQATEAALSKRSQDAIQETRKKIVGTPRLNMAKRKEQRRLAISLK